MPPRRLADIDAQINALRPDLVLIAGDLISEKRVATRHYSMAEALEPFAALKPRLGTVAVLGNHDHWYDAPGARQALGRAEVRLLENEAVRLGPLAIGGIDDAHTKRHDVPRTAAQMRRLGGARLLLSHSPDAFPEVPPAIGLTLAGHTHCGQIAPPLVGPITTASRHGKRFACGVIREKGRMLIVTAGVGTRGLPLRLGAVPELWLLTLGPRSAATR
jgi:predicted MPP superfamily phosphohydrolase